MGQWSKLYELNFCKFLDALRKCWNLLVWDSRVVDQMGGVNKIIGLVSESIGLHWKHMTDHSGDLKLQREDVSGKTVKTNLKKHFGFKHKDYSVTDFQNEDILGSDLQENSDF